MELKAEINKLAALEALRLFPASLQKNARLALKAGLRDIKVGAQQDHKFTTRGGFAEKSISDEADSSGLSGKVFIDTGIAPYAPFLHEGTGKFGPSGQPFPITPVNGKALRFVRGGRFVYARKVMNPGIKGDPFLYRSAEKNLPAVVQRFDDAVSKTIKEGGL